MGKNINVSLAFDNKFVKYACITLLSLFDNNQDATVNVYILQNDLTDDSREAIQNLASQYSANIFFIDIDTGKFEQILPTLGRWSVQVYFRLLLPSLLPDSVDRIIYLDSDMVVNANLSELFDLDISDYDMAACYDLNVANATMDVLLSNRHPFFETLFASKTYINSGMLLMNINNLRSNYTIESYIDAANELDFNILAPDQDLINYVHIGRILLIDPYKYNYPAYLAYLDGKTSKYLKENASIVHFVGEKPWNGGNHGHFETEMLWWEYALKSSFSHSFMENYIKESITDPTIFNALLGNDRIKDALYHENIQLKKQLNETAEQMKRVIALFEKK